LFLSPLFLPPPIIYFSPMPPGLSSLHAITCHADISSIRLVQRMMRDISLIQPFEIIATIATARSHPRYATSQTFDAIMRCALDAQTRNVTMRKDDAAHADGAPTMPTPTPRSAQRRVLILLAPSIVTSAAPPPCRRRAAPVFR